MTSTSVSSSVAAERPSPDPRVGLRPGKVDSARRRVLVPAGEAIWNMRLLSNTPPSGPFAGVTNSDLAFKGKYAIQGNYNGFQIWDISDPKRPVLVTAYLCPASQSDVSVYGNILFVSAEAPSARLDCGTQGVPDTVSHERIRGIRIFDISDIRNPKYIANVQTCRGSHTHTVVSDPKDSTRVYVYISGSARVRSPAELPGCLESPDDPNTALFRIEVIEVPLTHPESGRVVSSPRIFQGLSAPPRHAENPTDIAARGGGRGVAAGDSVGGRGGRQGGGGGGGGPTQCHDITVYPAVGLAGGACGGYGLLLDIRDVANPVRIDAAADSNFAFWHSATFSNDGSKILFTDEWGGGTAPRCRATDKYEWGGNAIFTIADGKMRFRSYYKMPAAQTSLENCVAHNGSLIPIPGREVMVQGWYQGGISVFDWTDPDRPFEIAFFDRGPLDVDRLISAGSWSVYWYNGLIVSSEIFRGLDILELTPSPYLSQNEIEAAKTVRFAELNAQEQQRMVWPPSFALARAYLDQLERGRGLVTEKLASYRSSLAAAERLRGSRRADALASLAGEIESSAALASDRRRMRLLVDAVRQLAAASR